MRGKTYMLLAHAVWSVSLFGLCKNDLARRPFAFELAAERFGFPIPEDSTTRALIPAVARFLETASPEILCKHLRRATNPRNFILNELSPRAALVTAYRKILERGIHEELELLMQRELEEPRGAIHRDMPQALLELGIGQPPERRYWLDNPSLAPFYFVYSGEELEIFGLVSGRETDELTTLLPVPVTAFVIRWSRNVSPLHTGRVHLRLALRI